MKQFDAGLVMGITQKNNEMVIINTESFYWSSDAITITNKLGIFLHLWSQQRSSNLMLIEDFLSIQQ